MKTYIDFLKERLPVKEGTKFLFIDLICEPLFEDAAEAYHEYRMAQYKEQGLILLPDKLTAENGAKALLVGEFIEDIHLSTGVLKHAVYWTTIKDIYKTVVEHFGKNKEFYCRKEVNKGIRCNSQCQACVKIDSNG